MVAIEAYRKFVDDNSDNKFSLNRARIDTERALTKEQRVRYKRLVELEDKQMAQYEQIREEKMESRRD